MIRKYLATASLNSYGLRPCNVREFLDWRLSAPRTKPTGNPMGRWNIDYCHKKINNKIDLSNEDH